MITGEEVQPNESQTRVNVADRLSTHAAERPEALALVACDGRMRSNGANVRRTMRAGANPHFSTSTFAHLDHEATLLARGLVAMGVRPGHRIALLVKPGVEFVTLVFALLRSGATMVLVDSGLGRKNIVRCLASTSPDGFIAIPQGHVLRVLMRSKFPGAKLNVTVGRRWFWGGKTLNTLRELGSSPPASSPQPPTPLPLPLTAANDPAAIVFTSGSTGPPKGVVYRHETFATQCAMIEQEYGLKPGAVDLACFPLFGLFNVACGVTTVLPEMDFSRPASCDPKKLFAAANQWKATQSFASPAVWGRLSRHAEQTGDAIPTLRRVFSCGAPVPAKVIRRTLAMVHPDAELHTPYGATEALPIATIEAREILEETAAKTDEGAGVCVGRKFLSKAEGEGRKAEGFEWRVVKISDEPIATIDETEELPTGEIGELIVRGPQVSRTYLSEPSASAAGENQHNALAKITDGDQVWHRMGDVGYFDEEQRFWYCGRKSQRVTHNNGSLFTDRIEAVFNSLPGVRRSALVGVGDRFAQAPVIIVELEQAFPSWSTDGDKQWRQWVDMEPRLESIWYGEHSFTSLPVVLTHPKLPTDIRHNSKIRREELAVWAAEQLKKREH